MLNYLIKTEIDGIEIRVVYSKAPDKYYVIYGLEIKEFENSSDAMRQYESCVLHAW